MDMGEKYLIVNGDDLGRTRGVTEGILQAHRRGIVSSTTVMANLPGAEAAIQRATAELPGLGVGIHLNLTAGPPVLPPDQIPSLVGSDGWFYPIRRLVPRLAGLDLAQVEAEVVAQIERFRSWGREPSHLDSHHHTLYLAPRLFQLLLKIAERYRLPLRYPWPRGEGTTEGVPDLTALAKAHRVPPEDLPGIISACHALLQKGRVPVPDRCILTFYGPGATLAHLLELIAGLPEGVSELMCHPGLADTDLRAQSSYAQEREQELAILIHPSVQEVLAAQQIRLTSFSRLRVKLANG